MKKFCTIIVLSIFLLVNLNQVVAADVVEETRTLYIQPNPDFNYMTSFNIINQTPAN